MDASWLHPLLGTTDGSAPQAYLIALRHVARALDADPGWRRWWNASGAAACDLGIVAESRLDHLRPSADIRREGIRLQANFTCASPSAAAQPAEMMPLAVAELRGMFEVIREALALPALPAVPVLPALPPNAKSVEVTTKTLPAVLPEPEQQGFSTLTQIQEFFR